MKILVTGASGFIGNELIKYLSPHQVTAITRSSKNFSVGIDWKCFSLEELLDSHTITDNYDVVVHLAGRAHLLKDKSESPLDEYRKINTDISIELARQLANNGLRRFVFVSSIGVNGATTKGLLPFTEESLPKPHSAYAISKFEAENSLKKLSVDMGFELVIVRPPLVYGINAPGNFGNLLKFVRLNIPLPFGNIKNKRSYISVANLASFLSTCCTHKKAANETFLICDGPAISTTTLLREVIRILGKKTILLPVPKSFLSLFFSMIGKDNISLQLLEDLEIDNTKAISLLDWAPIKTMDDTLNI